MRTRISKWGHSLAVRIPRAFAEQVGVSEGSPVEIDARGGAIVLTRSRYSLEGLLAGVRDDNLHGELGTGGRVGREEW